MKISICLALLVLAPLALGEQPANEEAAVRAAVLDYVEGVYEVAPERIKRSVHPELAKLGFGRRKVEDPYREIPMTFDGLVELAGGYNADGHIPKDAPKEVVVFEVLNQTASVKLTAEWGIDYMHLAKFEGRWKIVNVLWQTHPEDDSSAPSEG